MITTLTGENDLLRQEALQQIIDAFIAEHTDMALERVDGEGAEYWRIHEAVQSLPFLVSRKLVILRAPSMNKEFTERFERLLDDVAETNDVVLMEPKLDRRSVYYKQLKRLTDFHEYTVLDSPSLIRYLSLYASEQEGSLSAVNARFLVDRVGGNQLALRHELDKLLAYNPTVTRASIELLTEQNPHSSIFELLDAAFKGNGKRALQLYEEQRDMRIEPQQILAMLVWQLHVMALIKAAGNRSVEVIAQDSRISLFTIRKSMELSRHIKGSQIKVLIRTLRTLDIQLKTEGSSADEVVRYYLVVIATGQL